MRLYLITDDKGRSAVELASIVQEAISGGVTAVQFREKSAPPEHALECWNAVSQVCRNGRVPLFLNADLLSMLGNVANFENVHFNSRTLGAHGMELPLRLRGYSAHEIDDAAEAFSQGVQFVTLSPIYATASKPGALGRGVSFIKEARKALPSRALLALGGVDEKNADACMKAGADGIAVIGALFGSSQPFHAAKRLREIVDPVLADRSGGRGFS